MSGRLTPDEAAAALRRATPIPTGRTTPRPVPRILRGVDPYGRTAAVALGGPALVVFLSTTCDGCRDMTELVTTGVEGFTTIGAIRLPLGVSLPDEGVAAFIGHGGTWLLGDATFDALDVGAAPFFCVLDADGQVVVEGVALGWAHVVEHCERVRAGAPRPDSVRLRPTST